MAYKVLSSQILASIILFLSSIVLIRSLSKDDYGLYILVTSYFAFFELLLGGFNASLIKYIPTSGKKMQHELIATILVIKTIIVIFIEIALFYLYPFSYNFLNIPEDKIQIYSIIYIILSFAFLFKYIGNTISALINAYMLYDSMFKLSILNALVTLFIALLVWFFKLEVWQYVFLSILWIFLNMNILFFILYKQKKLSLRLLQKSCQIITIKKVLQEKVLSYSLPLFGVGILSYIKNYVPNLIFGSLISLESLAIYNIFTKIITIIHKGYASFLQKLYPKLFQMVNSRSSAINKLFWIGLFIRIFFFCLLYFGYDYLVELYKISWNSYNSLIFIVLLSSYLLMYFATFGNLVVLSKKKTVGLFISSFIRNVPSLFIYYYGFIFYGMKGFIVAIFINAYLGTNYIIHLAYNKIKNPIILYVYYIILVALIGFIYINLK